MSFLRPFFLLVGRATVFWLSAFGLLVVSMTVAGLAQPDQRFGLQFDATFILVFAVPTAAGWLAGAVTQEFQHTTVAMVLPGARFRIASGFLSVGVAVTVVVVAWIALTAPSPQNLPVLFVVGLGAYCLGGILLDPLSIWVTSFNVILVLFVIVSSREVARVAGDHPWVTAVVSCGVGAVCFSRLFARSTFRRKLFLPASPLPGSFSLEKTRQYQRWRRVQDGPKRTGWRAGYLGSGAWSWVRAAVHEVHGANTLKTIWRPVSRAWGLGLLVLIYAWADKGEMGFGEALARSIHDALLRSPHQPQFGEHGGPYPVVAMAIAGAGIVTALFSPVALNAAMVYPLSRSRRAQVLFGGGVVDLAIFLFIVGPCLFAVGHLAGWFVGYEFRIDYMPFFFRALMTTLILMPAAHWVRIGLQEAARRRAENTMIVVIFGIAGFVVAALFWTFVSPRLFVSPAVELATLVFALLISQLIYRRTLVSYYRTADLA